MRKHHGQEGRVYISSTLEGAAVLVCELSEWTLDSARDKAEVTSFCDNNKSYIPGKPDMTGSLSGFWNSDSDILFDAAESPDGVQMILYPSVLVPEQYWAGPAFLDYSMTVNVQNPTTMEAEWSAAGSWTRAGIATP